MDTLTRSEWGAAAAKHHTALPTFDSLVGHHLGDGRARHDTPSTEEIIEITQGIQAFHMITRGWSDIAYNWLIARDGTVVEGRGWNVQGAATMNENGHTQSVCYLSDGTIQGLTPAQLQATSDLYREARDRAQGVTLTDHNDWNPTTCPGPKIENQLNVIKSRAVTVPREANTQRVDPPWIYLQATNPKTGNLTDVYVSDGIWRNNAPPRNIREQVDPNWMDRYTMIPYKELVDIAHPSQI
jgi:N-acetylmuramoyl-L-alanine amidase